jgi:hypothetical protein
MAFRYRGAAAFNGALSPRRLLERVDPPEGGPHHGGLGDPLETQVQP